MYHKQGIEISPLQVYTSALTFSPTNSLIRRHFKKEEPKWIAIKPGTEERWSACLQTLEGHSGGVNSVAFSPDSTRLASASWDRTVKIWDASSGACLQTLSIGKVLYNISFDITGSCLHTDIGIVAVDTSSASSISPDKWNIRTHDTKAWAWVQTESGLHAIQRTLYGYHPSIGHHVQPCQGGRSASA